MEAEFDKESADKSAWEAAINSHDTEAFKIYSPVVMDARKRRLNSYIERRGAARDRSSSKEERSEAARQDVAPGKPLPEIRLFLEFLRLWTKRAASRLNLSTKS